MTSTPVAVTTEAAAESAAATTITSAAPKIIQMKKSRGRKPLVAGEKRKKKHKHGVSNAVNYKSYVWKVLKQVHPDVGMSRQAMAIMNSMVNDLFERITGEAGRLVHMHKKQKTLRTREVLTATRLTLPGELSNHAISEGTKAVVKYGKAMQH
jgi:hypothetical protein